MMIVMVVRMGEFARNNNDAIVVRANCALFRLRVEKNERIHLR